MSAPTARTTPPGDTASPGDGGPPARHPGNAAYSVRPNTVLTAIAVGGLLCVAWPLLLALRGPVPAQLAPTVAHICGLTAGYGVVVLIGLMSRTPALERGIGADRLARWHGRGGRAVVVLVLLHAWAAVAAWAGGRRESTALAFWHVLRLPWLISATIGAVLLLVVAGVSIRAARRRVRYERWHSVHLLVYIAVALGFAHQLAGPDLTGHRIVQVLWALLYTQVFALVLVHRVITPLRNATRHRMRVHAVLPEAPGVVSIVIEGRQLDELHAESGQFFRWRFLTPDLWWTAHPFSLSAAPHSTRLRLTVKALGDGSGTLQQLEPGTWVMAEGPYGAMTAQRRVHRDVLLIAGGVGITPMRALFETMPLGPGQDLLLLYRVRADTDIVFRAELEEIARERAGARLVYLDGAQVGPFTPRVFWWFVPNLPDRDVYLCGPPAMADAVRDALHQAGLPAEQLHEERFDF
jgi:predicted ferric reductase